MACMATQACSTNCRQNKERLGGLQRAGCDEDGRYQSSLDRASAAKRGRPSQLWRACGDARTLELRVLTACDQRSSHFILNHTTGISQSMRKAVTIFSNSSGWCIGGMWPVSAI